MFLSSVLFEIILDGSKGIGVINKLIKIFVFIGIISNSLLTFFTSSKLSMMHKSYKWMILFGFENLFVFFLFFVNFSMLPMWYDYLDKIKMNHLTKIIKSELKPHEIE